MKTISPGTSRKSREDEFPLGGGEMGALVRVLDWSKTSLGPISAWPAHLKTTISLMLPAQAQIVLFWGPEFVALYNDAYAPTIGDKHPKALGQPARENWAELWDDLEPLLRRVPRSKITQLRHQRAKMIERPRSQKSAVGIRQLARLSQPPISCRPDFRIGMVIPDIS